MISSATLHGSSARRCCTTKSYREGCVSPRHGSTYSGGGSPATPRRGDSPRGCWVPVRSSQVQEDDLYRLRDCDPAVKDAVDDAVNVLFHAQRNEVEHALAHCRRSVTKATREGILDNLFLILASRVAAKNPLRAFVLTAASPTHAMPMNGHHRGLLHLRRSQ